MPGSGPCPAGLANLLRHRLDGSCSTLSSARRNASASRALAHWLVYLQLIKYFLPKTAEDDWFLFLLGLMQVLVGSVVNQSDQVGAWLFLWAMLAIWVLASFSFIARPTGSRPRRVARRTERCHRRSDDPYPRPLQPSRSSRRRFA